MKHQTTFCYCPNCKAELVSSNSFKSDINGIVTYQCNSCDNDSKWYFDAPVPLLITK
jgi:Zn-finger protein